MSALDRNARKSRPGKQMVRKNKSYACSHFALSIRILSQIRYISYAEYNAEYFGNYCSGSAYIFTIDLLPKMSNSSKFVKFFWIDDYYVTGLLARSVNAEYHQAMSLYEVFEPKANYFLYKNRLFGHFSENFNQVYFIWNLLLEKAYSEYFSSKTEFKWTSQIYNQ